MKQDKAIKLPKGLKLFVADVIDDKTGEQDVWYVTGMTYDSALKRFIKWANKLYDRYAYYFDEADKYTIENFIDRYENIKAGIYD